MILECPRCQIPIVGVYGDLLDHIDEEHPLEKIIVDGATLRSVVDEIEDCKEQHRTAQRLVHATDGGTSDIADTEACEHQETIEISTSPRSYSHGGGEIVTWCDACRDVVSRRVIGA